MTPVGYLLADDLIFISRITGTAKAHGMELSAYRTPADLLARAQQKKPDCVLIDLHIPDLNIEEFVASLKSAGSPYVVGYGSHVAADVLKQARSAGCDLVLPRSQFVADLEDDLPKWFAVK